MTRKAWFFVSAVLALGGGLGAAVLIEPLPAEHWPVFLLLVLMAVISHLYEAEAPGHQLYYPHLVFFFTGLLLLSPGHFVLLVTIPHLVEWVQKRLRNSPHLRSWYIQPYNIATHIVTGLAAYTAYNTLKTAAADGPGPIFAGLFAALVYVLVNHYLIGQALVLARGVSWRESGIMRLESLLSDLGFLVMGQMLAALWMVNSWLVIPVLIPLYLIHRVLLIPQLEAEAQTDAKTGLLNARHFQRLFAAELDRAQRLNRPLTLVMADLDFLRNINNSFGHLAGDTVLIGVSKTIRTAIRSYDIAARFGGEEFAILLPEVGRAEAQQMVERLRRQIAEASFPVSTSPTPLKVTISLGLACFPEDATTTAGLIHEADVAVYHAKHLGRNRAVSVTDVPPEVRIEKVAEVRTPPQPISVPEIQPAISQYPSPIGVAPTTSRSSERLTTRTGKRWPLTTLIAAVTLAAIGVAIFGFQHLTTLPVIALGLLLLLAVITELLQTDLYGDGSVSVSFVSIFSAGLIAGIPGIVLCSLIVTLVNALQRRPSWYKIIYNWGVHVLAGLAPVLVARLIPIGTDSWNLLVLVPATVAAAAIYFVIDTGLVAAAIAIAGASNFWPIWERRFRWLAAHYLVLGTIGLFLAVAYRALGPTGIMVFALPAIAMHLAQQQYVARTRTSVQELHHLNEEIKRANRLILAGSRSIKQLNDELFMTLAKIVDTRDPYVSNHAAGVADYACRVAQAIGLQAERIELLRRAALLHDIGKIGISDQIINKPTQLTKVEFAQMQAHARLGADLLSTSQSLRELAPLVLHHHERWDGQGYPDGLAGETIPLEARILAICDAVEMMRSERPYQQRKSLSEAISELERCSGTQFDPELVRVLVRILDEERLQGTGEGTSIMPMQINSQIDRGLAY